MSSDGEAAVGLHLDAAGAAVGDAAPATVRARTNNFDAIRLVAALLVLCSHQLFFLGKAQPTVGGYTLGELAVMMFVVISGYLVAESWYRDPHLVRFILRRFLRLWPGLAAATIVIAAASVFLTSMAAGDYLGAVRHFVARNLQLRIVYELPGVFAGGSGAAMAAVNGSWWTIPVEAKCYLYLALLGVVGLRRRWLSVLAFAVVAFLYLQSPTGQGLKYLYILFFATGLCARQFTAEVLRHRIAWSCAGLAAFLAAVASGRQDLATWVIVAPLVLLTGSMDTPGIRSAGRFGDLSYGIYIYAYFVQQLSVRYWPANGSLAGTLVVSVVATAALAWCSWHAVEAPALALKRRLRRWFPDRVA